MRDTNERMEREYIGYLAKDDPAAFWSALTPEQALALLKEAPKAVADAWTLVPTAYVEHHVRRDQHGNRAAEIEIDHKGPIWRTSGNWRDADTLDAARNAADAALRAAGWLLVDDAAMKGGG